MVWLEVLFKVIGVVITVPRVPWLLKLVHGAEISLRMVPVGTLPLETIVEILRVVPVGTIEVTFMYMLEFETGVTADPATEVDKVMLTGEGVVLVLSRHLSLTTIVNCSETLT